MPPAPILNVVTATAASLSQPVTAQASASIVVNPVVAPTPALSITKSTTATTYSTVGSIVTFTLVATNTGNATLDQRDDHRSERDRRRIAPRSLLTPGETLTCTARHVVTQADLDQGTVTNIASVSGTPPTGPTVTRHQRRRWSCRRCRITVAVAGRSRRRRPASRRSATQITYTITATNTGNVTLMNVAISDPNGVLRPCAPIEPGARADVDVHGGPHRDRRRLAAKVIVNQAHATALPMISTSR